MQKTLLISLGIIIFLFAGYKLINNSSTDMYGEKMISLCFYKSEKTDRGLFDRDWLRLNLDGNKVTGEFQHLPAEKDSKVGLFEGEVGSLDPNIMGRAVTAWWQAKAEGTTVTEELVIHFGEGDAKAYFGEMVDRGDGVYIYKDKSKLKNGPTMFQIYCGDLDEILTAEEKLKANEDIINLDEQKDIKQMKSVTLNTNKGNIKIELYEEQAPNTVANFTKLAGEGFYDGVKFHRVIKGFMIQSGDPLSKDDSKMMLWGTGGPGYKFADELGPNNKNDIGTISMANAGPNTNGSQFFINVAANNFLDGKHTVFGKVVLGMEVVTAIENTPVNDSDRPVSGVVINSISVE